MTTLKAYVTWACPNCRLEHRTDRVLPNRWHACPSLHGLTAPMVRSGTAAKVEAVLREDFVGRELVTLDGRGRPVMAVVTTRDDGRDVAVFAPLATARTSS